MVEPLAVDRPIGLHHRPPGLGVLQEVVVLLGRPPNLHRRKVTMWKMDELPAKISLIAS